MTVTVKKKLTKKEKEKIFNSAQARVKPIDVSRYKGKFKWEGDPLKLQKEWRDE
jgi:hypothetical protein